MSPEEEKKSDEYKPPQNKQFVVSNEFLRVCKFTHNSELQDFFISNFSSKIVQVKNSFYCYKLFHVAKAKIISWHTFRPNQKRKMKKD